MKKMYNIAYFIKNFMKEINFKQFNHKTIRYYYKSLPNKHV